MKKKKNGRCYFFVYRKLNYFELIEFGFNAFNDEIVFFLYV